MNSLHLFYFFHNKFYIFIHIKIKAGVWHLIPVEQLVYVTILFQFYCF